MPPLRFLIPALLGFGLAAAPAAAQTVTVPDVFEWSPDHGDRPPTQINRADCLGNASIEFKPDVTATDGNFEVWAGSGCTDKEARLENSGCVQVAVDELTVETLTLRVQDLLQEDSDTAGPGKGTPASCERSSGTSGDVELRLFFMVIDPGSNELVGTHAEKTFAYDIFPPPAPTDVTAGPGEEAIELSFTPGKASDLNGYRFYCSDVGPQATGDGGAGPDVPSGDGSCTSSVLVPGEDPPEAAFCGDVSGMGIDSGTATGRMNNVVSAVGVAAVDDFGNVGKLSELACATPKEVTGFYEAYRAAGGQAGGGFCSFTPPRRGAVAFGLALLLGGLALVRRRR